MAGGKLSTGRVETDPLVFWYQWDCGLTSFFFFFAGYLRLAMGKLAMYNKTNEEYDSTTNKGEVNHERCCFQMI